MVKFDINILFKEGLMNKFFQLSFVFALTALFFSCAKGGRSGPSNPQNLPPIGGQQKTPAATTETETLQPVLDAGVRSLEWLNKINATRDTANRLNLADTTTKNPVPPESPKVSSTDLILTQFEKRKTAAPASIFSVIFENANLTENPPIPDADFLKIIRGFNSSYQGALRWLGHQPWLDYYEKNATYDIRGYYFFNKNPDLVLALKEEPALTNTQKQNAIEWLVSMCKNSEIKYDECLQEVNTAVTTNTLSQVYNKYLAKSESTYNDFFKVNPLREDLKWNINKTVITQDFITPNLQKVSDWFKTNVEEEWKLSGFQLMINFVQQNDFSPFLEFVKGVTPHVSGDTWNKITMDPDYSLEDYDTQWTIRHEFGHVLGFPDCYLEFYNKESKEMIYYTIEPDNLMCAWGGSLKPKYVDELKREYK